jgi:crotonobetainyl-CoA:carnitine CoA-transferase CaiB-like acyl-CoA transferase
VKHFSSEIGVAFESEIATSVEYSGGGGFGSAYSVTDFVSAAVGAVGAEVARLIALTGVAPLPVSVDRRLASYWCLQSARPSGWDLPPVWDAIAGDYPTTDAWIRLHTNAPHHRASALSVLGLPDTADKPSVTAAVATWTADDLETAVVDAGGCAAAMRTPAEWDEHPQGIAVRAEALIDRRLEQAVSGSPTSAWELDRHRPLRGVKVLDLTRILAGPVATRTLAGFGADVLRLDPPGWDEPSLAADLTVGKRCARLDLRNPLDRARFEELLCDADILVHGYRGDALDRLGLDARRRRDLRPDLIDVSLNAYGWTGPWSTRRGFDSLVQMSSGIAHSGMALSGAAQPRPLPAQFLDHVTGYLMAAAAIRGLCDRVASGRGSTCRLSLARTARLLVDGPAGDFTDTLDPITDADFTTRAEQTVWGELHRLRPPLQVEGAPVYWDIPAGPLGTSRPQWRRS